MPLIVRPATVTIFDVPTFLSANVAVALPVARFTTSGDTTPTNAAEPLFNNAVADTKPSYTLLLAVMPLTVSDFDVTLADVVGCVSV